MDWKREVNFPFFSYAVDNQLPYGAVIRVAQRINNELNGDSDYQPIPFEAARTKLTFAAVSEIRHRVLTERIRRESVI